MKPQGLKIAEGRDSEIFEHGPGRVMRVPRDGRSLEEEAAVMTYVRSAGYPAPEVFEAGDGYLVMERLDGPTLLDDAIPFRVRRNAWVLADLHLRLHQIPAPPWLTRQAPVPGDRVVHRDLHPLNVLVTAEGPVVIDWSNAARGAPEVDVAEAWILLACADPPQNPIERVVAPLLRRSFVKAFLGRLDQEAARRALGAVVEARSSDPNMSSTELRRMKAMARRHGPA